MQTNTHIYKHSHTAAHHPVVKPPLAFTRYCFTSKLHCESLSFLCCPPQTCNAYPVAILLHAHCAMYAPPPTLPVYAIHHTILVMAISCKGQSLLQCTPRSYHTHQLSNRVGETTRNYPGVYRQSTPRITHRVDLSSLRRARPSLRPYIYTYIYINISIYRYIYRERDTYIYVYTYKYIHICICTYFPRSTAPAPAPTVHGRNKRDRHCVHMYIRIYIYI